MADSEKVNLFFQNINRLTTGDRAALKRSSGTRLNDSDAKAFGVFYKVLPRGVPEWQEDKWFTIACLTCLSQPNTENGQLIEKAMHKQKSDSDSFENRVISLLDCEWDEDGRMNTKLTRMIKLLKSKNSIIDTRALLNDLLYWDHPDRFVQKKWARAFQNIKENEESGDKDNVN